MAAAGACAGGAAPRAPSTVQFVEGKRADFPCLLLTTENGGHRREWPCSLAEPVGVIISDRRPEIVAECSARPVAHCGWCGHADLYTNLRRRPWQRGGRAARRVVALLAAALRGSDGGAGRRGRGGSGGGCRLTRQARTDPRYSVKFEDMFSSRLNRGGKLQTLVPFTSHFKGFLKDRQQFAVNLGFWCLAERRCDCSVDPCACGNLVPFDSCASSRSMVAALLRSLVGRRKHMRLQRWAVLNF